MHRFTFLFLSIFLFTSSAFAQTSVSFQDGTAGYSGTQDTFVHEKFPGSNFGSATILKADGADGAAPSGEVATLVKWDVSSIPAGSTVTAATVSLEFYNTSGGTYNVLAQTSSWTEGSAVWADLSTGFLIGQIPPASGGQTAIVLNATGIGVVQSWVDGTNNGIAIRTDGSNDGIAARSSESSAYHPKLEVTYTTGGGGAPTNAQLFKMIRILQSENAMLKNLLAGASRVGNNLYFDGMNVYVRNGLGATNGLPGDPFNLSTGAVNGLGNLIVGYDENSTIGAADKSGSHNLVVGPQHNYPSFGGFVAGLRNKVNGRYSSVSGGATNTANGSWSSVSGGNVNKASGVNAAVSGGQGNQALANYSSVSGGLGSTASGLYSSVSGGFENVASGSNASISGGEHNEASMQSTSVSGGRSNTANNLYSSVSGGISNTAGGIDSSVSGGIGNTTGGTGASISGGQGNASNGLATTVSGGRNNSATHDHSVVVGGNSNSSSGNDTITP